MTKNISLKKNETIAHDNLTIEKISNIINTGNHPEHFGASFKSACVFLLFSERDELYVTVILKADNKGYPWANQIALPGGHIDPSDKRPVDAAYRELKEELNISESHIGFIGSMGHFLTINSTEIEVFTGVWDEEETIRFDKGEIAKVYTVPFRWFVETHFNNNLNGRIPGWDELLYPVEDVVMWGATAKIMHYLIELIYN